MIVKPTVGKLRCGLSKRNHDTGKQEQTETYRYTCGRSNNDGRECSC